jgi:hypothetical protein
MYEISEFHNLRWTKKLNLIRNRKGEDLFGEYIVVALECRLWKSFAISELPEIC